MLLPTTVVGSYPQPDWLIDRDLLSKGVPRANMRELWRIPAELLHQAHDDATLLAIRDMERAGIDIITDGEMRRESYSNYFVAALEGVDAENPSIITNTIGKQIRVPRVHAPISRKHAVEVRDLQFLRANTDRKIKITLPGPFTMAQQAHNDYYADIDEMAMAFASAVNQEVLDLQAAGADVIQLDEPWLRNDPVAANRFAVQAINRALQGVTIPTVVHLCFGYAAVVPGQKPTGYSFLTQLADSTAEQISIECAQPALDLGMLKDLSNKKILLGVIDLGSPKIERGEDVAARIRAGLKHVSADRMIPAPDCGMKYLSRATAFGKLKSLAEGAAIVRRELS
jgi:5-methyltetrahydropteroyltriglutamate--homocysteine methyltransferase